MGAAEGAGRRLLGLLAAKSRVLLAACGKAWKQAPAD